MLNSSSSSDTSGSSNGSDSDDSSGSHTTAKRIRRAFRGRRRRKSSVSSDKAPSVLPSVTRTPSAGTFSEAGFMRSPTESVVRMPLRAIASGDEADTDGERDDRALRVKVSVPVRRDFETEKSPPGTKSPETRLPTKKKRHRKHHAGKENRAPLSEKHETPNTEQETSNSGMPRVGFAENVQSIPETMAKRPAFGIRGITVHPAIPKMLTSTVFSTANPSGPPGTLPVQVVVPPAPYGLRRASSLPDRLNKTQNTPVSNPPQHQVQVNPAASVHANEEVKPSKLLSRTAAVILLLTSTALVAICAEFLVSSISYLVSNTSVSEEFIGLIILPIVGNAAEHVTAVTVASKNKMDLAISVAVGSSIQIALFVTPVIVLLGWCLGKDMSLYFSLFETIALFVSAFIVNFLVLDGRSNYLEGALLIAAYVIIAVAAFFYPNANQQSMIGGAVGG
jgi:Ca2+:H+ antiporter